MKKTLIETKCPHVRLFQRCETLSKVWNSRFWPHHKNNALHSRVVEHKGFVPTSLPQMPWQAVNPKYAFSSELFLDWSVPCGTVSFHSKPVILLLANKTLVILILGNFMNMCTSYKVRRLWMMKAFKCWQTFATRKWTPLSAVFLWVWWAVFTFLRKIL